VVAVRLGGFLKLSFCDWPGRPAAVVFTQGCNFRCPWCHNPSLVHPHLFGPPVAEEEVLAWLARRHGLLGGVVVSGGEPALQPDLPAFLDRLKALGLAVKLDTNGSRPEVVEDLLAAGLVDQVAVDYKVPAALYPAQVGYAHPERVLATVKLVRQRRCGYVRTTVVPGLHTRELLGRMEAETGGIQVFQPFRGQAAGLAGFSP
jgi:pyruvate formate lyase activating enzyme